MSGTALSRDQATEEEFVASLYKGGELLAANKVVEAREHLEKANRINPKNEKAQNLLGLAYFKLGLFDQASAVYEALVRENPADPTLRVNLGLVYLKTNNLTRSVHEFETATDLEPTHKKAHNYLGLALAQAGDYQRARDHFVAAGSDAMAEKMAKALEVRVENTPASVEPSVPSVIVSPDASAPETEEDVIEVMSDEQESPSGEMTAVEEVAVDVAPESHTELTQLPDDAIEVLGRPSRPNLSATDWGEQLQSAAQAPSVVRDEEVVDDSEDEIRVDADFDARAPLSARDSTWAARPEERELVSVETMTPLPAAEVAAPSTSSKSGLRQRIEATWHEPHASNDSPASVGQSSKSGLRQRIEASWESHELHSEAPATTPQPPTHSKSGLRERIEAAWGSAEQRELVSVESMTPLPEVTPIDPSWASAGTARASDENDWSQSGGESAWSRPETLTEPIAEQAQDLSRHAAVDTQSERPQWSEAIDPNTPYHEAVDEQAVDTQTERAPWATAHAVSSADEVDPNAPYQTAVDSQWAKNAPDHDATPQAPLVEATLSTADEAPDWVAAPDPLAAIETSPAEPDWVSQPLSQVNFTAAGLDSIIAQPGPPSVARETVPTYEPAAVEQAPHVDLHIPPKSGSDTEPRDVRAIASPPISTPSGYSPMGSQRLLDLGASTQWVPEGERGPFHLGHDGMAVTVNGEMLVRLSNLVAVVGSVQVTPEMRRIRGRATDQPFGAGVQQLQRARGSGVLYLEPGRSLFHAIDLDDEGAYLREERVFAFEEPVSFENGRLTDADKAVDLVNLKGQGRVLLQLDGPLKAMPIPVGSPMAVPLTRLIGWFGRVTPRLVGLVGQGAIELTGEGFALLGTAAERS